MKFANGSPGWYENGVRSNRTIELGNGALGKVVNESIEAAMKDGSYDAIYKKWFGGVPPPATTP